MYIAAHDTIKQALRDFCKNTWENVKQTYDLDPSDSENRMRMYDRWYDDNIRTDTKFTDALAGILSKELTTLTNSFISADELKKPPRLRIRKSEVTVEIAFSQDEVGTHGHYQSFGGVIKVFVNRPSLMEAGCGALQEYIFGEGDGIEQFVDQLVPIFIHEYTHYEQWERGLSGKRTRGYISAGGEKKNPFMGDNFTTDGTPEQQMRYTGAAHEVESYAAGAAVELIQSHMRYGKIENSDIDDLCQSIALCYSNTTQMQRYWWLREYRDHYIEQGFDGQELEIVFKRFMKILYKKLQQFRSTRVGKAKYDPNKFPADWVRYAKNGLSDTIQFIAADIAIDAKRGKNVHEEYVKAGDFVCGYFINDEWDFDRQKKISNLIKKIADLNQ
jgi:hypothetical protein